MDARRIEFGIGEGVMIAQNLAHNAFRVVAFVVVLSLSLSLSAEEEQRFADALRAAADFILGESGAHEERVKEIVSSLEVGESGFDRTNGGWVRVYSPTMILKVTISDAHVVWAMDRDRVPEEHPVVDDKGIPVPEDVLLNELVQVPKSRAEADAERFVRDHVGADSMEGMLLSRSELVRRGSHYAYTFVWSKEQASDELSIGTKSFYVTEIGRAHV